VSVAAALILFEAARQREQAGMYRQRRLDGETFARMLFEWCYPDVARRCRDKSLPYPDLSGDGFMLDNPLPGPSNRATPQGT
jgi:tRNA (guanosine-2'-O-)-methyltransferase